MWKAKRRSKRRYIKKEVRDAIDDYKRKGAKAGGAASAFRKGLLFGEFSDAVSDEEPGSTTLEALYARASDDFECASSFQAGGGVKSGKGNDPQQLASPLWLLSFTDVMALMLTFFVLLYSMSTPDRARWQDLPNFYQQDTIDRDTVPFGGEARDVQIATLHQKQGLDLDYLYTLLETALRGDQGLKDVRVFRAEGRVVVALPRQLAFGVGQTTLTSQGRLVLLGMSDIFQRIRNRIEVVGHADPSPVRGGRFVNNWELSLARAHHVAEALKQMGYKRDIHVRGVSGGRYPFIDEGLSKDLRYALARRVDIVFMPDQAVDP